HSIVCSLFRKIGQRKYIKLFYEVTLVSYFRFSRFVLFIHTIFSVFEYSRLIFIIAVRRLQGHTYPDGLHWPAAGPAPAGSELLSVRSRVPRAASTTRTRNLPTTEELQG
ncbi:unnamed protein product, partial [Leptidea sinapis]